MRVHSDGEFAPLQALIASLPGGTMINLASANKHVPEIERKIRVVKEKCRAARHGLPFQRIPKLLTIHIVLQTVKLLNFFPTKGGIFDTLSTKTIMYGEILDYKKHLSLHIGKYCQVNEEDAPRNIQNPRTKGAIYLVPSGNLQGGFNCMALNTGKKIVWRSWDVILMPDKVIMCVNALGRNQPEQLIFTNRRGRPIGDVKIPGVDPFDVDHVEIPGVDPSDFENIEIPGVDVDIKEPQVIEIVDPNIPPTNTETI